VIDDTQPVNAPPEAQAEPVMGIIDPSRALDEPIVVRSRDNRALFDDLSAFAGLFGLFVSLFREK
jgi:hypothetical protein